MAISFDRRQFLWSAALLVPARGRADDSARETPLQLAIKRIKALEAQGGGRIGVAALDTASRKTLDHRSGERFPMCSTFKFLAVANILQRVDAGRAHLDDRITFGAADLLEYAPVLRKHVAEGAMSIGALCAAAIAWSDNSAANLLLRVLGGPAEVTRYIRTFGDETTRLDRIEPDLNAATPGDDRDTTAPLAMLGDMEAILLGRALSEASRRQLLAWMSESPLGRKGFRAGIPQAWGVAAKTGSGGHGTMNCIALLSPPDRAPILAAAYSTGSSAPPDDRAATLQAVAEIIAGAF